MSNSKYVNYTKLSPNHSGRRTHSIDRITPHCVVGQCSVETLGRIFQNTACDASCNYGIGYDGRVLLCVDEGNRSWCSSSNANDQRAVTIECASDSYAPYAMNSTVYSKLVALCTDICRRNGKKKLIWFGNESKTLNYTPKSDEMIITVHRWFANKSCPGDWLYNRLGDLASAVTKNLGGKVSSNTTTVTKPNASKSGSNDIKKVQKWLGCKEDGIYGPDTKKHLIKKLQSELNKQFGAGLAVDGIWGPKTRNAISYHATLYYGCSGNITKVLQGLLICNGYKTGGFDSIYGNTTRSAVKKYQSRKGLTSDGIAGANTFSKLCG